ncbi:MAG: hypothetical protein E7388_03455 [Ruminococcaceae bacterium]|nr:hypothetical protein [Oscillospiraceae bacterium]
MAYEPNKKEFSIKEEFERAEKEKNPEYRKRLKYGDENPWTKLLQIFGMSVVGGVCGGIIFFACRYWFSIFSVLFFVVNGLAAYVFSKEFVKTERKVKGRVIAVFVADIFSVFITLVSIYLLIPDYANERIAKGFGIFQALNGYFFGGMMANMIWIEGILLSFLGTGIGWFLLRGSRNETAKRTTRK